MLLGARIAVVEAKLIWVPAQRGIEGNEIADRYAKSVKIKEQRSIAVTYNKAEIIGIVKSEMKSKWQKHWYREGKG